MQVCPSLFVLFVPFHLSVSFRKRKMVMLPCSVMCCPRLPSSQRCDGAKPACQQCARAKKADGCEYDDGKGKTRTQILRETIVKLEQRVRELEDPEYVSPSVTLIDPHFHSRSNSSSSSFGSPESSYLSASHSPFPSGNTLTHLSPLRGPLTHSQRFFRCLSPGSMGTTSGN